MLCLIVVYFIFFCKIKATTEIYTYGHTLSLHDALPISDTRSFDYAIHGDDDPSGVNARNAAIVNLFYMNNWLHDWWYDHGFDEQAGNAQTSNYGRGGVEGDAISAQGQDSSEIGRAHV